HISTKQVESEPVTIQFLLTGSSTEPQFNRREDDPDYVRVISVSPPCTSPSKRSLSAVCFQGANPNGTP
ncbi:UNVERIFIED_CONTAM: hypothetical protein GTU68_056311, partial [Idotea baltica]|nr:hypothetical protein [Idotea baltica]